MTAVVPESRICTVRPTCVSENSTFIIDVDAVHFSDLKSDDMGTWKTTGTKSTYFRIISQKVTYYTFTNDLQALQAVITKCGFQLKKSIHPLLLRNNEFTYKGSLQLFLSFKT